MFQKKYLTLTAMATATLFFTACTSSTVPVPAPPPVSQAEIAKKPVPSKPVVPKEASLDLSQKSESFHSGMNDGCSTAKGKYKKSSASFSSDADYKEGWFYGRRKCQAHLGG